ncbi:MAG: hypothetical protein JWN44_6652 [Myxococcales bacterium]|nr:hypothetical protein [Myxococcales bacterium]
MRRGARVASLLVPSLLAWVVVRLSQSDARGDGQVVRAGMQALLPLFVVMAAALLVRAVEAAGARRSWTEALDILSGPGRALVWTAAAATAGAPAVGWASLGVLGLAGLAVAYALVTWTALVAAGEEPWRGLVVTRSFSPATAVEGDALKEELTLSGTRVPAGFRLLVRAGLARHRTTAYALDGDAAGGEIALTAELGEARRGCHDAGPAELWLQDLFGLCRSRVVRLGAGGVTVLPRPEPVDDLDATAAVRGDDAESVPSVRLPTEGCFRIRPYATGDDARRIHWVRSLAARELMVRLPDEIPPELPSVRLVLDTQLVGAAALTTPATGQLCDALVRVWISAGQSLVARGVRVTMVCVAGDRVVAREMTPQSSGALLRLGARVDWQATQPVEALLSDGARQIVVSARPRVVDHGEVTWIVVPEPLWTDAEPPPLASRWATLPYPSGSAENRWWRRRQERAANERTRRSGLLFDQLLRFVNGPHLAGSFVAQPRGGRVALELLS